VTVRLPAMVHPGSGCHRARVGGAYDDWTMSAWLVERRLSKVSSRLKSLRVELSVIDEQLSHLGDDADEQAIRALVSETAGASFEARDAQRHVDALAKHRVHVVEEIASLEQRQDDLLDRM